MSTTPDEERNAGGAELSIVFRGAILDVPSAFPETVEFYSFLFGEPRFVDGEAWAPFASEGDISVNLAGAREATGAGVVLSFKVNDLEAAREELRARGGSPRGEITAGGHQRQLMILDPAGNAIVLYEPLS